MPTSAVKETRVPAIGAVPNDTPENLRLWLRSLVDLISIREGIKSSADLERAVLRKDLENLGLLAPQALIDQRIASYTGPFAGDRRRDGEAPPPVTAVAAEARGVYNLISWTNPTADEGDVSDAAYIAVYYSTGPTEIVAADPKSEAGVHLAGLVPWAGESFPHTDFSYLTSPIWYYVYVIDTSGNYSPVARLANGVGLVVTIRNTINYMLDALFGTENTYTNEIRFIGDAFTLAMPRSAIKAWAPRKSYTLGDVCAVPSEGYWTAQATLRAPGEDKGDWDDALAYVLGDVVYYVPLETFYIALQAVPPGTGAPETVPTYWQALVFPIAAPVWSSGESYAAGDLVQATVDSGGESTTAIYEALAAVGPIDTPPEQDLTHWEALWQQLTDSQLDKLELAHPVFRVASVDGIPTLGILGNIVADGTIAGRHILGETISADKLEAHDIFTWSIRTTNYAPGTEGLYINGETGQAEFNDIQLRVNWTTDVTGVDIPAVGATQNRFFYQNEDPTTDPENNCSHGDIWVDTDDANRLWTYDDDSAAFIHVAQTPEFDDVQETIDAIESDSIFSIPEKISFRPAWRSLVTQYEAVRRLALVLGLPTEDLDIAYTTTQTFLETTHTIFADPLSQTALAYANELEDTIRPLYEALAATTNNPRFSGEALITSRLLARWDFIPQPYTVDGSSRRVLDKSGWGNHSTEVAPREHLAILHDANCSRLWHLNSFPEAIATAYDEQTTGISLYAAPPVTMVPAYAGYWRYLENAATGSATCYTQLCTAVDAASAIGQAPTPAWTETISIEFISTLAAAPARTRSTIIARNASEYWGLLLDQSKADGAQHLYLYVGGADAPAAPANQHLLKANVQLNHPYLVTFDLHWGNDVGRCWVNGTLCWSGNISRSRTLVASQSVTIGCAVSGDTPDPTSAPHVFTGYVRNVRFVKNVLTQPHFAHCQFQDSVYEAVPRIHALSSTSTSSITVLDFTDTTADHEFVWNTVHGGSILSSTVEGLHIQLRSVVESSALLTDAAATLVTDVGETLVAAEGMGTPECWVVYRNAFTFDPSKLYKITVRAKQSASGSCVASFGIVGQNEEGFIVEPDGFVTESAYRGYAVAANTVTLPETFTTYEGYFGGVGTASTDTGTIENPTRLYNNPRVHSSAPKTAAPLLALHSGGLSDTVTIESLKIEEYKDTVVAVRAAATNFENLRSAVTIDHFSDRLQAALSGGVFAISFYAALTRPSATEYYTYRNLLRFGTEASAEEEAFRVIHHDDATEDAPTMHAGTLRVLSGQPNQYRGPTIRPLPGLTWADTTLHHYVVVASRSTSTTRLYLDGTLVASTLQGAADIAELQILTLLGRGNSCPHLDHIADVSILDWSGLSTADTDRLVTTLTVNYPGGRPKPTNVEWDKVVGHDWDFDQTGITLRDSLTGDYAKLSAGDIQYYYYNPSTLGHELYQSLRRAEFGTGQNAVSVDIPGLWKIPPNIHVTPTTLSTYIATDAASNQRIEVGYSNVEEIAPGTKRYRFTPIVRTVLDYAPPGNITWPGAEIVMTNAANGYAETVHETTYNFATGITGLTGSFFVDGMHGITYRSTYYGKGGLGVNALFGLYYELNGAARQYIWSEHVRNLRACNPKGGTEPPPFWPIGFTPIPADFNGETQSRSIRHLFAARATEAPGTIPFTLNLDPAIPHTVTIGMVLDTRLIYPPNMGQPYEMRFEVSDATFDYTADPGNIVSEGTVNWLAYGV